MNTMQAIIVSPSNTDADIRRVIRNSNSLAVQGSQGFLLFITGYDDDPRELWDIPECIELIDRLVAHGILAVLDFNIGAGSQPLALGGFVVWIIHKRKRDWDRRVTKDLLDEFLVDVGRANNLLDGATENN